MKAKALKKLLAGVTTLAMAAQFAFVLPANAAVETLVDSDGSSALFEDYSRTTVEIVNGDGVNTGSFERITTGNGDSGAGYTFATVEQTKNAVVTISFDAKLGLRPRLSLRADKPGTGNRNDDAASRVFTLGQTGAHGVEIQPYGLINSAAVLAEWRHYEFVVDCVNKTTAFKVYNYVNDQTDYSGDVALISEKTGFRDENVSEVTSFDYYSANPTSSICIDNMKIVTDTPDQTIYTVTYNVDGVETKESVVENAYVTNIPATDKTGYIFKGWQVGDDAFNIISTKTLKSAPVTASVTYTAVFEEDPNYIEEMASVEFSTLPPGYMLVAGADANTSASNPIAVSITGELGSDLLENPDPRVDDFSVVYELKGFRWIASENRASSDLEGTNTYCDGYGTFIVDDETHTADFQLRRHFFNYYGQIVATVTYNEKTITISKPLVFLGDTSTASSSDILPRGGYISDFGSYSPDMAGYITSVSSDNRGATDVVTDNWATYGGNSTRQLQLVNEDGSMFMRLTGTAGNSSCFAANQITAVTDSQVVFDQMVRFHNAGSSILWKTDNPVTWDGKDTPEKEKKSTSFSVNFTGTEINIDGQKIADATTDVWYRLVINSSVGSKRSYALLYSEDGELLGQSKIAPFTNPGSVNPTYYMFRVPDETTNGMLDFNDVKIYRAAVDQDTYTVTPASPTLSIPEEEGADANTVSITASAKSTEGYDMISPVTWSIQDAPAGITITPNEDTHTAVLSVENGVSAGPVTVLATLNGITKSTEILLTTSSDSISFLREYDGRTGLSPQSISIPMDTSETSVAEYKAAVVDKDFEIIDENITYRLIDSNGNDVSAEGVSFEDGVLTVTSNARAMTVWVEATGRNSDGETLVMRYRVVIHGLSFDFGEGTEEDVAEGYTSVTPTTGYNETQGYGIEGVATAEGTASIEDPTTDYLTGTFTFKANVEKNKIYKVTLNYVGNAEFENISTDLPGVLRQNKERATIEYLTFVNDDVLDITFSDYIVRDSKTQEIIDWAKNEIASIEIEKVEDKTPGAKPNIYTVGDSTAANNGSWAYVLAGNITKYPKLDELATFSNNGRGGKNLSSYYTGGELWDRVITQIRPGDYVMIGDMGTNGMGADFEGSFNYYIDACLTMGAKVILNSYSPHMAVGDYAHCYDSSTHTFDGWRRDSYDNIVREIYEERKDELEGFVEIGKNADESFTAYVADYAANGHSSKDEAAQAIIACAGSKGQGPDHNHYSNGTIACELMLNGYGDVKGIVAQLVDILSAQQEPEEPTVSAAITSAANAEGKTTVSASITVENGPVEMNAYAAIYDENGAMLGVKKLRGEGAAEVVFENAGNAATAKVFVWKTGEGNEMIPFCYAAEADFTE